VEQYGVKVIKQKFPILAILFFFMVALSLFSGSSLHAATLSDGRNQIPSEKREVESDSLSRSLKSAVQFSARDSVIYNLDTRSMELWGKARIDHEETSIKAPKIVVDLDTSLLHAFGLVDSSKTLADPAVFSDRKGSFNAETMSYNFRTGRGETTNVSSTSKEIVFSGEHVTRRENGEMVITDGTFTTCDNPDPHYWFSSSSMTIIPDERVVATPFVMYARPELFSRRLPAIPVLALPYMVFPLKGGRSSGFLMPFVSRDSDRGYYLSNLGYFWAIDDYMDLRLEGDLAFQGSWRLGERFRYAVRNSLTGEISGEYKHYPQQDEWNAKIVHNQLFDPTSRLDINVQFIGGDRSYDLNSINQETVLIEQPNAYASLAKTFNDEQGIAALFYNRSEDLRTQDATQGIGASLYQNRIYPFRSGFSGESAEWVSDISITTGASIAGTFTSKSAATSSGYSADASVEAGYYREFSEGSKALFTQGLILHGQNQDSGISSDLSGGTSVVLPLRMQSTLFRYLNLNPALTFTRSLSTEGNGNGFSSFVFAVDARTRLYGVLDTGFLENMIGLKALRHTFVPTISYTWNPAFSGGGGSDYFHHVYDWPFQSSFNQGIPEGQSTIGISLKNLFQGKLKGSASQEDEASAVADHRVQLLSLTASTAYNFSADAIHLAPLTLIASSNSLLPNVLFSAGSMYDFYSYDPISGERINRLNRDDGNGLLRFVKGFLNMSFAFQGSSSLGSADVTAQQPLSINTGQPWFRERFSMEELSTVDYTLPWQLRFSLYLQSDRSAPLAGPQTTSLINAAAKAALSKEWLVGLNSGYDLQNKKFVFPMLQLYRNLHCWQMNFQWVPCGEFRSYAFQIGLKMPQFNETRQIKANDQ